MKLCFFTTLDKFHNNKVLAVALVRNEYVASFAWCFEEFRIAFKKVDPKVMFTDGDVGMRSAIRRVFPNASFMHVSSNAKYGYIPADVVCEKERSCN